MRSNAALDFEMSAEDMETLRKTEPLSDYGEATRFPVFREGKRAGSGRAAKG